MSKTAIEVEQTIQSTTDQFQFVPDEVNVVIHESLELVLGNEQWDGEKQEKWNNRIMEIILEKMSHFKKPYKYIVVCSTVQRTGCCVDAASACFWDTDTDGSVTVRWESPDIYAVVSVFGTFI
ncbi:hypothetical protein RUM44_007538 [Polyplax serrata]|uniref:Uncharacterized protein n=1 Tax=Polyplax serrata TaxID=468196 RepID=A0ABR1B9U4_POLSC